MTEYSTAEMDRNTKSLTTVVLILLLLFPISSLFFEPPKLYISIISFVLLYGVIFISYGLIPKRIAVSDDQILIKNLFGSILININQIDYISEVDNRSLNLRAFGVGGLFGYFGYFNSGEVWYVTNVKQKVRIVLQSGKTYMISPTHARDFVNEVQKQKARF